MRVEAKNEYLLALLDGEPVATCPDLICLLDRRTAEPIAVDGLRLGDSPPLIWSGGSVGRVSTPDRQPLRIGNREREEAVRELGEHFAEGRLDPQEYEERTAAAYAARTADDLAPLFADLPRAQPEQPSVAVPPAPAERWASPAPPVPRDVEAPYGREPGTGVPYSDRYKMIAGVLQVLVPFGIGRFYAGQNGIGLAQLLLGLTGIGVIWSIIDGILMLVGRPVDRYGRPLRP